MLFLYGANLRDSKKLHYALTNIRGIGLHTSNKICDHLGFGNHFYVYELTDAQISKICQYIEENLLIEGDLRKDVYLNISRLVSISSYRGLRHAQGLPLRGQRTHTNGRTQKKLSKRYKKG